MRKTSLQTRAESITLDGNIGELDKVEKQNISTEKTHIADVAK